MPDLGFRRVLNEEKQNGMRHTCVTEDALKHAQDKFGNYRTDHINENL